MKSWGTADRIETANDENDDHPTLLHQQYLRKQQPMVTIPVSALQSADSPRLSGENLDHARALAELQAALPPIIVNRSTMRVIDGMHRLRAAVLRGQDEIEVKFFDGNEADAFVLAVEANITHGLPLSLADRAAATARIIKSHPHWSDRKIGAISGVSAKTVSAIRQRSTEDSPHLNTRVGRDGRVRPLDITERRKIAGELMAAKPDASLREIASSAGISLGTAQDVRQRLRCGQDPVLPARRGPNRSKDDPKHKKPAGQRQGNIPRRTTAKERSLILYSLRQDPSLRFADAGRAFLCLLHVLAIDAQEWDNLIDYLPKHCVPLVFDAARACVDAWQELADKIEQG